MPQGTRLPIKRLLAQIPEIASQVDAVGIGTAASSAVFATVGLDGTIARAVMAVVGRDTIHNYATTRRLIQRHFQEVERPENWRDLFAISTRPIVPLSTYQSKVTHPYARPEDRFLAIGNATADFDPLSPVLSSDYAWAFDAWITPSLYRSREFEMPPDIARYAIMFYASSLVRYKPNMFSFTGRPSRDRLSLRRNCTGSSSARFDRCPRQRARQVPCFPPQWRNAHLAAC